MNNAQFLHTSMGGSYYEDCEIIAWNAPYTPDVYPELNKLLGTEPGDAGKIGAIIKYYDDVSESWETVWVEKSRIKLPPVSERIGM